MVNGIQVLLENLFLKPRPTLDSLESTIKNVVVFHSKGFILVVMECSNGQWTAGKPSRLEVIKISLYQVEMVL